MSTVATTTVWCRRCSPRHKITFEVPLLSASEQARVAELARAGEVMATMRLLRELSGIELRDAKGVELHITRTPGICQRCREPLTSSGQTECPNCGSLNFDW